MKQASKIISAIAGLSSLVGVANAQNNEPEFDVGVDINTTFPVYACSEEKHVVALNVDVLVQLRTANVAQADKINPILDKYRGLVTDAFANEISDLNNVEVEVAFSNLWTGMEIEKIDTISDFGVDFDKAVKSLDTALGLVSVPKSERDIRSRHHKQVYIFPTPDYTFCGPKQDSI